LDGAEAAVAAARANLARTTPGTADHTQAQQRLDLALKAYSDLEQRITRDENILNPPQNPTNDPFALAPIKSDNGPAVSRTLQPRTRLTYILIIVGILLAAFVIFIIVKRNKKN
jgi:hypothetical protein